VHTLHGLLQGTGNFILREQGGVMVIPARELAKKKNRAIVLY